MPIRFPRYLVPIFGDRRRRPDDSLARRGARDAARFHDDPHRFAT